MEPDLLVDALPYTQYTCEHINSQVEKAKKKNRKMLLSRLKNRNKTGPSVESQTEAKAANKQGSHLVSRNTWTAPELETVLPPSGDDHNSTPSLQQKHKDITAILPQLPNCKGVKLPPIKRKH